MEDSNTFSSTSLSTSMIQSEASPRDTDTGADAYTDAYTDTEPTTTTTTASSTTTSMSISKPEPNTTQLELQLQSQSHPQQDESASLLHQSTTATTQIQPQSHSHSHSQPQSPKQLISNFILLSILFSANHGAVVACLSLATARLGDLGSYQSSILYLSYTLSALIGATAIVKHTGARNSIRMGMWIYCIYIACFVVATWFQDRIAWVTTCAAILGAFIGGIGGGFLWTAQGSYFARAAEEYAMVTSTSMESATSMFGGLFAGIYLGEEVLLRLLSSILIRMGCSWVAVFSGYTAIAIAAALLMVFTVDYPVTEEEREVNASQSTFYKSTVTIRLLAYDPKMKYMAPLCAAFALSAVFLGTFVNAVVLKVALGDTNSAYVGFFTSITSAVGGIMSVVFGFLANRIGNATILMIGCMAFFGIASSFLLWPDLTRWGFASLTIIYALQGVGRATFEGALKAEFANVFDDKEAAFGNIIFQNGLVTTLGFIVAADASCEHESTSCIKFDDGRLHNTKVLEWMMVGSAMLAVAGYHRAQYLYKKERAQDELQSRLLGDDHLL
jgi:MFS family permease